MSEGTSASEVAARLREVPFLQKLPAEVIDMIRRRGTLRHLARGEPLFMRGESAKGLLVVVQGSVRIYQIGDTGREHVLRVDGPGSSIAELPLFDGGPYPAYGEANEDSLIFTLGPDHFKALLHEHPELAEQVIRALAQRLRRLVQTVEGLALKEVRQRVAAMLLQLAEQHGSQFMLPYSNEQIAAQLGTVREVVSRTLHGFAHDGLMELDGREVKVLDQKGLQSRA